MSHRISSKRAGLVLSAIVGGGLLGVAALSPGCKGVVVTTIEPIPPPTVGETGDPCRPEDEARPDFAGFKVTEENIESRSGACNSGVCLVNHIQGRAGCPLGQAEPTGCAGPTDTSCANGASCVPGAVPKPYCYHATECESGVCDQSSHACQCTSDAQCPQGAACDTVTKECRQYVCHRPGECQSADATDAENAGKSCCADGADTPVTTEVCGQCEKGSGRNAAEDIYCSCRCGLADGATPDGSEFCACPLGFECAQIRPDVGIGDPLLSGKYCIKQGTAYTDPGQCGAVSGQFAPDKCDGTPAH
jgi:hypothetical protein